MKNKENTKTYLWTSEDLSKMVHKTVFKIATGKKIRCLINADFFCTRIKPRSLPLLD
jgi:hypothetical protein